MAKLGYNPFDTLSFSNETCFLSGKKLTKEDKMIPAFPEWLMQDYNLAEQPFKLLDESILTYNKLVVPCSAQVYEQAIAPLDHEVQTAFNNGYVATAKLEKLRLFQWISKLVYSVLHNEIQLGMRQQRALGEEFHFSQALRHKLRNLHFMLQSLITPTIFEEGEPWSIQVFPVNNPVNTFSYRDEINTLMFSLRMKDFGIIASLQDNGANSNYHKDILGKVQKTQLHPIQFEELCAKFYYSAYLLNRLPEYTYLPTEEAVFIEAMPLMGISNKPIFDYWQNKTYGQVLENFWKPWGYALFEIIKDPEKPMSFLLDNEGKLIQAETINLPL